MVWEILCPPSFSRAVPGLYHLQGISAGLEGSRPFFSHQDSEMQRLKLAETQIPSLQTQARCSICGLSPQLIKISISLIRAQMMFVTKWDGPTVLVTLPSPFCGAVRGQ